MHTDIFCKDFKLTSLTRNNSLFPVYQKISTVRASGHTYMGEQVCMRYKIYLHLNTGKSDGKLFIPLIWK